MLAPSPKPAERDPGTQRLLDRACLPRVLLGALEPLHWFNSFCLNPRAIETSQKT